MDSRLIHKNGSPIESNTLWKPMILLYLSKTVNPGDVSLFFLATKNGPFPNRHIPLIF